MTRVLVTGGTGFLGGFVVKALIRSGYEVRIFDARPNTTTLDFVERGLAEKVDIVCGDIVDRAAVLKASEGCGYAIHLAGLMTVDCRRDPPRAASVNLLGSLNVFEAAIALGLRGVAYVSTAGVFGVDDGSHPLPMTHYGALKLAVEGCARAYFVDHGLRSVGFRPYIVYGPGASAGISSGPSIACRAAYEGVPADILFSGRVGFVHVEDVADAFVAAVGSAVSGAEVYNLVGEVADVSTFVGLLREAVPAASIGVNGPPLLIASDLDIGQLPEWLAQLPVTAISKGIARTLGHYAEAAR